VVPSFDDIHIIEGQGTVGVEIAEQLGAEPPAVVVPCGGGGLSAEMRAGACFCSRIYAR
jgi:threonine dehydratase